MKKNKVTSLVLGVLLVPLFYLAYFDSENIAERGIQTIFPMVLIIVGMLLILIIGSTNPDDSH